eukprot:Tamp_17505.p1 GENE.Tamp_17505~~Tamp_17505.p1  ORF type:complete len:407 (-),score=60.17 Tamp_17505:167-1351(-)
MEETRESYMQSDAIGGRGLDPWAAEGKHGESPVRGEAGESPVRYQSLDSLSFAAVGSQTLESLEEWQGQSKWQSSMSKSEMWSEQDWETHSAPHSGSWTPSQFASVNVQNDWGKGSDDKEGGMEGAGRAMGAGGASRHDGAFALPGAAAKHQREDEEEEEEGGGHKRRYGRSREENQHRVHAAHSSSSTRRSSAPQRLHGHDTTQGQALAHLPAHHGRPSSSKDPQEGAGTRPPASSWSGRTSSLPSLRAAPASEDQRARGAPEEQGDAHDDGSNSGGGACSRPRRPRAAETRQLVQTAEASKNKNCHYCEHAPKRSAFFACLNPSCDQTFCENCNSRHLGAPTYFQGQDDANRVSWHCPICTRNCCCTLDTCDRDHLHCKRYRRKLKALKGAH